MTRLAAIVFIVNTFLPLVIAGALVIGGWQSYRAYVELIEPPVAALSAKIADVERELGAARDKVAAARDEIERKGAEVGRAMDAAAKPFNDVAGAVSAVANASIDVKKPSLRFDYIRDGKGRIKKVLWFKPKVPSIRFDGDPFRIGMPAPIKDAFGKMGEAFGKMVAFATPLGEMVATIKGLGPDLAPLQRKLGELEGELGKARAAAGEAVAALDPVLRTVGWLALLLGPWIVLSYVCWVWMRLRRWRAMLAGRLA